MNFEEIKHILYNCSKTIDESTNRVGTSDEIIDYINELQQENQQLRIQISAREEEYRELDETNKVLSQELTKDKFLKQDHLKNCCGIPIGDMPKFIDKYNKLEDNWNELKSIIEEDIKQCEQIVEECPRELRNTIIGTKSYETIIEYNKHLLSKMQELEKGKSE